MTLDEFIDAMRNYPRDAQLGIIRSVQEGISEDGRRIWTFIMGDGRREISVELRAA